MLVPLFSSTNCLTWLNPAAPILSFSPPSRTVTIAAAREFDSSNPVKAKFGPFSTSAKTHEFELWKIRPAKFA
jgi:hypothetical protein